MIKNFLEVLKRPFTPDKGEGEADLYEIWDKSDFVNKVDFICRIVMPPNTSTGYHQHGNDEEIYIILEGKGTMTIEGKEYIIKKGDMIKNPPFGSHGLVNDSNSELDFLVLQLPVTDSELV